MIVKPVHVVTSIKQSPVLKGHPFLVIVIEMIVKPVHVVTSIKQSPVLKDHLFLVIVIENFL